MNWKLFSFKEVRGSETEGTGALNVAALLQAFWGLLEENQNFKDERNF